MRERAKRPAAPPAPMRVNDGLPPGARVVLAPAVVRRAGLLFGEAVLRRLRDG